MGVGLLSPTPEFHLMSRLSLLGRAALAASLAGAVLAPAAQAADANVRSINRAIDGSVTAGMSPFAVSGRGTEVLAILGPNSSCATWRRGPPPACPVRARCAGSPRRRRSMRATICGSCSTDRGGPAAAGHRQRHDYYLLDRSTGTNRLVSRTPSTFDDGSAVFRTDSRRRSSPGMARPRSLRSIRGKFNPALGSIDRYQADEWRWDRGTNTATRLGGSPLAAEYPRTGTWNLRLMRGDDAGKVGVFDHEVYAGTRTVPLPLATGTYDSAIVSSQPTAERSRSPAPPRAARSRSSTSRRARAPTPRCRAGWRRSAMT